MEEAVELLTKMYIEEYEKENEQIIRIRKQDLIKFCIKLLKTIEKN